MHDQFAFKCIVQKKVPKVNKYAKDFGDTEIIA